MIISSSVPSLMEGIATMSILAQRGTEKRVISKRISDMKEVKYIPGDLVQFKQIPNVVGTVIGIMSKLSMPKIIEKKPPIYEIIIGDNEGLVYLNEEDIVGVPLTPKILNANEWTEKLIKIHNSEFKGFEHKMFHLILEYHSEYGFSIFYWGEFLASDIKYVHQLQHLLFGLGFPVNLKV